MISVQHTTKTVNRNTQNRWVKRICHTTDTNKRVITVRWKSGTQQVLGILNQLTICIYIIRWVASIGLHIRTKHPFIPSSWNPCAVPSFEYPSKTTGAKHRRQTQAMSTPRPKEEYAASMVCSEAHSLSISHLLWHSHLLMEQRMKISWLMPSWLPHIMEPASGKSQSEMTKNHSKYSQL